ncbi:hypothetical protein [Amycolatopsis decaplanina]|uniref:hypothetical protein n=1 Tax=Amycolatopsis decaplanina TaxID=208441 RepID=UPI0003471088|nr:hypothetical protein [Amycolatopsis decaplanina]
MAGAIMLPIGISLSTDIEYREGRAKPYKARVRWVDPVTKKRPSKSESVAEEDEARKWLERIEAEAENGVDPRTATMSLAEYGEANMPLVMRAWRRRRWTRTWPAGGCGSCRPWGTFRSGGSRTVSSTGRCTRGSRTSTADRW